MKSKETKVPFHGDTVVYLFNDKMQACEKKTLADWYDDEVDYNNYKFVVLFKGGNAAGFLRTSKGTAQFKIHEIEDNSNLDISEYIVNGEESLIASSDLCFTRMYKEGFEPFSYDCTLNTAPLDGSFVSVNPRSPWLNWHRKSEKYLDFEYYTFRDFTGELLKKKVVFKNCDASSRLIGKLLRFLPDNLKDDLLSFKSLEEAAEMQVLFSKTFPELKFDVSKKAENTLFRVFCEDQDHNLNLLITKMFYQRNRLRMPLFAYYIVHYSQVSLLLENFLKDKLPGHADTQYIKEFSNEELCNDFCFWLKPYRFAPYVKNKRYLHIQKTIEPEDDKIPFTNKIITHSDSGLSKGTHVGLCKITKQPYQIKSEDRFFYFDLKNKSKDKVKIFVVGNNMVGCCVDTFKTKEELLCQEVDPLIDEERKLFLKTLREQAVKRCEDGMAAKKEAKLKLAQLLKT